MAVLSLGPIRMSSKIDFGKIRICDFGRPACVRTGAKMCFCYYIIYNELLIISKYWLYRNKYSTSGSRTPAVHKTKAQSSGRWAKRAFPRVFTKISYEYVKMRQKIGKHFNLNQFNVKNIQAFRQISFLKLNFALWKCI